MLKGKTSFSFIQLVSVKHKQSTVGQSAISRLSRAKAKSFHVQAMQKSVLVTSIINNSWLPDTNKNLI